MDLSKKKLSGSQILQVTSVDQVLSMLPDVAPTIYARAGEAEAARRVPTEILQLLTSTGIFRMTVPKVHGGLELDFPAVARALQALAKIDGSIGWLGTLANATGMAMPLLPRDAYEKLYRDGPDPSIAAVSQPAGIAVSEPGGLRVSGRWPFASGCEDADWILGMCVLNQDGKPVLGPAEGIPALRAVCLPAREWQIDDTWQAPGLRATGSHHVVLNDVFVPSENVVDMTSPRACVPGPLYANPMQMFPLLHGPIALGLAEGALEDLAALAVGGRKQQRSPVSMRDSEIFQYEIGRVQAGFRAAQAAFDVQAASQWQRAIAGTLDQSLYAEATQSVIWVTEACLQVVQSCFALAGSAALSGALALQRRLRDMQTAAQHAAVQQRHYVSAGEAFLRKMAPAAQESQSLSAP